MLTNEYTQTAVLRLVNKNRITTAEAIEQMGLDSCNIRCISTNVGNGKLISKRR